MDGSGANFQLFPEECVERTVTDDMAVEQLALQYNIIEKRWLESASYRQSAKMLRDNIKAQKLITRCICFGTGTTSGLSIGDAFVKNVKYNLHPEFGQGTALYQIAIFTSVIDIIESTQVARPSSFVQETMYTGIDRRFLASIGISVKEHPAAFDVINGASFVYIPNMERRVALEVHKRNPALFLGHLICMRHQFLESNIDWKMSGFEVDFEWGEHRGTDAACHIKSRFAKARSWDKVKDLQTPEVDDDE